MSASNPAHDTASTPTAEGTGPEDYATVLATSAADAGKVANLLVAGLSDVAGGLRAGLDHDAMNALADLAPLVEAFVAYLVHAHDSVGGAEARTILDLHDRILDAVEQVNRALRDGDYVEVADCVEMDMIPAIADYLEIEAAVAGRLSPTG